jgi:DNA primase
MEIDLLSLVQEDGFQIVRKSTSRSGQFNGPCPFCGGTDRFRVQPNQGKYGWFACSQCDRKGNAVDYLMIKRGMSRMEALAAVGWMPKDGSIECAPPSALPKYVYEPRPQWNEPLAKWQEAANDFCQECQRLLWRSEQGQVALAYLRRRGLQDKTIKAAMLGYHPREEYGTTKEWGRPVWLPQGIVIPWFLAGKIWRVTIRDERVAEGENGRYKQVAGGSNGLYLADTLIKLKRPTVVMVEGEFDALSLAQECGDLVAVVATGTTQGSHTPRWISLLARQECVLIAFDAEDKGDSAAKWWMDRLAENAQRLRPWWKDANQMLQDGADLRQWVESANIIQQEEDDGIASLCSVCGALVEYYNNEGIAFCSEHWQQFNQQPEPAEPEQPIQSVSSPSSQERLEQFAETVSRLASVFPGICQILPLPPNTTVEQWLAQQQLQLQPCKQQPRPYTPFLLPPLPRAHCPAKCLVERIVQVPHTKQTYREPRLVPCKQKPLTNGWCEEHQLAQKMLDLGALVDYPALQLNQYRGIQDGKATWEEYVIRAPRRWLQRDIQKVQALVQQHTAQSA